MFEDEEVVVEETIEEQPVEVPETKPEPKTVPLSKFLSEKDKRKALEREIAELRAKSNSDPTKQDFEELVEAGFDESAAKLFASKFAALRGRDEPKRDIIGEELDDLILEEFFDDAKTYEKEIREAIEKSHGALDVRSAYVKVRDPSERAREIANRERKAPTKAQPVSRPAESKSDALTESEKAELKKLQMMMPDSKWDADSYKKYARGK